MLVLMALALVLRLAYVAEIQNSPYAGDLTLDSQVHHDWAVTLAGGDWSHDGAFFRAPVYPYLLGIVYTVAGPHPIGPILLQALLSVAGCWLLYWIARELFDDAVGIGALAVGAAYSMFLYFVAELLITTLAIFLDLLALALLLKARRDGLLSTWFVAGLVLGFSAVTRPNILLFVAIVPVWIVFSRLRPYGVARTAGAVTVLVVGCLLPIAPITAHNVLSEGDVVLIASQGGVNFYIGNNPRSDGVTAIVPGTRGDWWGGYEDQMRIARDALGDPDASSAAVSRYWYARGWRWIRDHPVEAARHSLYKIALLFNAYETGNNRAIDFVTRHSTTFTRLGIRSSAVIALAAAGIWLGLWRRRNVALPLLFVLTYSASIVPFFVCSRFRMPVMAVLIVFAAYGLVETGRALLRRPRGTSVRQLVLVGAAVALAVLVWATTRPLPEIVASRAQGHYNEATALREQGRIPEAVEAYEAAIETRPCFPRAQLDLARIHSDLLEAPDTALTVVENALRACGDDPQLLYRAGILQLRLGRLRDARRSFLAVEAADGADPDVHIALAMVAELLGDTGEARRRYRAALDARPGLESAVAGLSRLEPEAD